MVAAWRFIPGKARRIITGVLPVLEWSRSYDAATAVGDLIAGVTIALTLIPQSIAYASLAGLEAQYGLYASFVGGFVYAFMGTVPQINIGPTALLSLLTFTYIHGTNPDFAVLLCFITGIVQLIAGIAQLGFLVDFVSLPVVSGFTSAAAITIASSQMKGLLGLRFSAETFVDIWRHVATHIGEARLGDSTLSLACCCVLMGMKALKDIRIKVSEDKSKQGLAVWLQKALWLAGVSRNATVVVVATALAYCLHTDNDTPFILTGKITPGLPVPSLPPFSSVVGNTTYSAGEMFAHLGSGLLVLPIVGIIANVAIAKAFSTGAGRRLEATQEIIALGACNVVGAFFSSFPVNGSFTRSAVSAASGVRTPAAGLYTGILVVVTLLLLTPCFYFIPRAALASVIVCAVLHMVDCKIVKKLWNTSRMDLIPLLGTFVVSLGVGVETGLVCGVLIDVLLLCFYNFRPPLDVRIVDDGILPRHYAVTPVGGLHFAAAESVRTLILSLRDADSDQYKKLCANKLTAVEAQSDQYTQLSANKLTGVDAQNDQYNQLSANKLNGVNADTDQYKQNNLTHTPDHTNFTQHNGTLQKELTAPRVIVFYCEGLHRIDYTFLQSLKMLMSEWTALGSVVWYNARPHVRRLLCNEMPDLTFCDQPEQLAAVLTGLTSRDVQQVNNGTHL